MTNNTKDTMIAVTQDTTTRYAIRVCGILPDEQLEYYRDMIDGMADSILDVVDTLIDAGANVIEHDTSGTRLESFVSVEGTYFVEPLANYTPPSQVTTMLLPTSDPDHTYEPRERIPYTPNGKLLNHKPWGTRPNTP